MLLSIGVCRYRPIGWHRGAHAPVHHDLGRPSALATAQIMDRIDVESSNESNKCEVIQKAYLCSPYSPKLDWYARADLKKIVRAQNAALKLEIEQKYPIAPWNQHARRNPGKGCQKASNHRLKSLS